MRAGGFVSPIDRRERPIRNPVTATDEKNELVCAADVSIDRVLRTILEQSRGDQVNGKMPHVEYGLHHSLSLTAKIITDGRNTHLVADTHGYSDSGSRIRH